MEEAEEEGSFMGVRRICDLISSLQEDEVRDRKIQGDLKRSHRTCRVTALLLFLKRFSCQLGWLRISFHHTCLLSIVLLLEQVEKS